MKVLEDVQVDMVRGDLLIRYKEQGKDKYYYAGASAMNGIAAYLFSEGEMPNHLSDGKAVLAAQGQDGRWRFTAMVCLKI